MNDKPIRWGPYILCGEWYVLQHMMNTTKTGYICPVCHESLFVHTLTNPTQLVIFCDWQPCPSRIPRDGVLGKTNQEAYDKLCRMVEIELGQNDRDDE